MPHLLGTAGAGPYHQGECHQVEFPYFDDCPSHVPARTLLDEVIADLAPGTAVEIVNTTDHALRT